MAGDGTDEKTVAPIRNAAVKNGDTSEGRTGCGAYDAKSGGSLRFPRINDACGGKQTVINASQKTAGLLLVSKLSSHNRCAEWRSNMT